MSENNGKPTVAILDDEEMVTISLRNLFRLSADYNVLTFATPEDALEVGRALQQAPTNREQLVANRDATAKRLARLIEAVEVP